MQKINFTCEQMHDVTFDEDFEVPTSYRIYNCHKRGSIFTSISDHCYDCPKYKKMLDEVCKILED